MKIALITAFPPSRQGLNEYGFHVAEQLRQERCVDLTVLGDYLPTPADELPGFKVDRCWGFGKSDSIATLVRTIRQVKPDVAWFNLGFASFGDRPFPAVLGLLAPAAARLNGVYSHVTLHQLFETVDLEDAAVSSPRLYRAGGWLATHLLLSANSLSVLMPAYRRTLDEKYRRGRVSVKSHGIFAGRPDPPDFTRRGNPIHRILAFGKWGTYKRLELLIEAFNRVATKIPNVELVIGGGDHPKTAGYVQSMAQQHANDRIHFLGYVPEDSIADLFREASLAVMPYTSSAGSSGVAHLAAQYGVPVIASGIRDFRDLAEHEGIAMRFFTPADAGSLVEEILLALNSPDQLKEMAWKSYAAGVAMSMPQVVREYIRAFRQQERVKTLQLAADLRRGSHFQAGQFQRKHKLARTVGEKIQRWRDEDEITSPTT
ncbi:MAG: glycosyltransferase [Candidatus Sulfotelmatobacter sp.]|jgi:glycosyltransferase involved in cell wall biosynthesis